MTEIDDAAIEWIARALVRYDAALLVWRRSDGGLQPVLFPRTLCLGRRAEIARRRPVRHIRHLKKTTGECGF